MTSWVVTRRPLNSTDLPCSHTLADWDVSAVLSSSRHTSPQRPYRQLLSKGHATTAHVTTHKNKAELEKAGVAHSECTACSKIFYNKGTYKKHMTSHRIREPLNCTACGKGFQFPSQLSRHLCIHMTAGEKAAKMKNWKDVCYFCDKRLQRLSHLESHLRTHTKEKPFFCNQCQSSFAQTGNWTIHKRTHSNNKEKKYHCEECGRYFVQPSYLVRHKQAVHLGQRPHKCPQCNSAFAKKSDMVQHLNSVHLKIRHACTKCDKTFSEAKTLRRPINTLH